MLAASPQTIRHPDRLRLRLSLLPAAGCSARGHGQIAKKKKRGPGTKKSPPQKEKKKPPPPFLGGKNGDFSSDIPAVYCLFCRCGSSEPAVVGSFCQVLADWGPATTAQPLRLETCRVQASISARLPWAGAVANLGRQCPQLWPPLCNTPAPAPLA